MLFRLAMCALPHETKRPASAGLLLSFWGKEGGVEPEESLACSEGHRRSFSEGGGCGASVHREHFPSHLAVRSLPIKTKRPAIRRPLAFPGLRSTQGTSPCGSGLLITSLM